MARATAQMRVIAVALALLWGLAPLLSAAHADDHVHRYCAEHGTFEEAGEGTAKASTSAHAELHAMGEGEEPLDHAPCTVAHLGPRSALLVQLGETAAPTTPASGACARPVESAHRPIAPLRLAPKASPPAPSTAA